MAKPTRNMIDTLYIESAVAEHWRTLSIQQRFPKARLIYCERYSEVFNPKAQNFRLQKQRPALILAKKFQNFVLPTPLGYGIGTQKNYYFSHMFNCLYDCRYCFLQGMYQSANYVLFVNFEDFFPPIQRVCLENEMQDITFFSGYDCDSLALEPVTGYVEHLLPFFAKLPNAWLELRTKSTQIRGLLNRPPTLRCIVAFSLSPEGIAHQLENKAPTPDKRIEAAARLQDHGWTIGLRFDPLVYQKNYKAVYHRFFACVFAKIDSDRLHSVSIGGFRLPENYYKKILKLYPEETLFAGPLHTSAGMVCYPPDLEQSMLADCITMLLDYIPKSKIFACVV
jgi:spore photoproduct lyase